MRRTACRKLLLALVSLGSLCALGAAPAAAQPVWNLDLHHSPTNFPPGGTGSYWFELRNHGDTNSSGPVTLTVELPAGLTRAAVESVTSFPRVEWSCPGAVGDSTVVCTTADTIRHWQLDAELILRVDVAPGAAGRLLTTAKVEGGGASASASAAEPTDVNPAAAGFGIVPGSFRADLFAEDGTTLVRQSGAHPFEATFGFDLATVAEPKPGAAHFTRPAGTLRDLSIDLPPGFVGNPSAVEECVPAQLLSNECPLASQVGRLDLEVVSLSGSGREVKTANVYNMRHPRGTLADLGAQVAGQLIHLEASLDPSRNYALTTEVANINESLAVYDQKLSLWGVPADPRHDWERCPNFEANGLETPCPTDAPKRAFLTAPWQCDVGRAVTLRDYSSWQDSAVDGPAVRYDMPGAVSGCEAPRFEPSLQIQATGGVASEPTGLEMRLAVPQEEDPDRPGTPPAKRLQVTFPPGMSVSAAAADGLAGCSPGQIGLGSDDPVACPDASRIGTVSLSTPLLPEPLEGSLYLASQADNPFGSLLALYAVLEDEEERGILLKLPGRVDLDPSSGRITAVFDELPQYPFAELKVGFRAGPRAPLVSPPTCGTHTVTATLSSYARPAAPIQVGGSFEVGAGAGGTACAFAAAARSFSPRLVAGTRDPIAGAFSPFDLRVARADRDQELSRFAVTLPPGLTGKLAGIPYCPDGVLGAVAGLAGLGQGAGEVARPSCPPQSRLGAATVEVGPGPSPFPVRGVAYLAGPYRGAPLSVGVVTPALAGPFDLGVVLVRAPLEVDPRTAQITAVADPLPTILHGIPLNLRSIQMTIDRPGFTLNPTSCDAMAFAGEAVSTQARVAPLSSRFQVGGCRSLAFKPRLSLRLFGATRRGANPKLRATVRTRSGEANLRRVAVALPRSELLDQSHIDTVCTRAQLAADACPRGAVYGWAKAWTPLLDRPLVGPVYLRSSGGERRLPDLLAALSGPASQPIQIHLEGFIDSVRGGIRTRFESVPDAPVSRFVLVMKGGRNGLLVNSRNLCRSRNFAKVRMRGQNGKARSLRAPVKDGCRRRR